jgi:hypothetical protein
MKKIQRVTVGSLPPTAGFNPQQYLTSEEVRSLHAEFYRELYKRLGLTVPEAYRA